MKSLDNYLWLFIPFDNKCLVFTAKKNGYRFTEA